MKDRGFDFSKLENMVKRGLSSGEILEITTQGKLEEKQPSSSLGNNGEIHASFNDGPKDTVLQTLKHKVKTVEEVKSGKSSWVDRVSQESDSDRSR